MELNGKHFHPHFSHDRWEEGFEVDCTCDPYMADP